MYRVMIVDDEPIIRRGIRNSLKWEEYELEVVCEAVNGREALDLSDKWQPDIVIADICMPEIDGLEMSEKLLEKYPNIKIIVITGYDEFEYAQRACKLGVIDYVLKPTDADDLVTVLEKAKGIIKSERNSVSRMEELQKQLHKHLPIIRENYLIRLVTGVQSLEEIGENQKILNINEKNGVFQIGILNFDTIFENSDFADRMEMLHFAVKKMCQDAIDQQGYGWTFYDALGQIAVLFYLREEVEEQSNFLFSIMDGIQQKINKSLKAAFSIGMGRRYKRIKNIKRSYEEAKEALEYRFIVGNNSIIFIDDVTIGVHESRLSDLLRIEKEILKNINKANEEAILLLLDRFFQEIKSHPNVTPLWAKAKCYELVSSSFLSLVGLGVEHQSLSKNAEKLYSDIYQSSSLEKAFALVEEYVCEVVKTILLLRNIKMRKLIDMGKQYIQEHYREEISVADLAEHLYVTPNYFSRLFKKETGEACTEYINRTRMEKAKKLLKSTLYLSYEIANMVGFKDANYFSIAFKKYEGISPTEYRDSIII